MVQASVLTGIMKTPGNELINRICGAPYQRTFSQWFGLWNEEIKKVRIKYQVFIIYYSSHIP